VESPAVALLQKLTQLSRAIAQAASLDDILQLAATQASVILEADQTVLMLMGDDGLAHVRASEGVDLSLAESLPGKLDETLISRLEQALVGSSNRSFLAVPMIVQGEVTGLIAVTRERGKSWSEEDEVALAAVADQSAAPIEIARLSEEVRQARLVAENARLGQAERAARAELEAERARLATVLDNIPVGVVLAEAPSGRVTFRNRAALQLKDESHSSSLARAIRGETVNGEEIEVVRKDGTRVILSVNAAPIRDPAGDIVAGVSTFNDVTHRRRVEQHLRQVQQMEAVGRLAGGVAHETNNQMSVVLSAASFILHRPDLAPQVRTDIEAIQRAAERTAAVTAQLLAFGRRQILRPQILNLNEVIQEFAPVLRRTLGEDSTLVLLPDPAIGPVRADRGQIEQVLLNLALNSRDAMPRGGRLTIETSSVRLDEEYVSFKTDVVIRPGLYVRIAVSDTGHGFDRQTLNHLFEPFFTTKPVGQGTGLGLSTVYGIVKQSEGYIWAYSEPGQGAAFKIYLPVDSTATTRPPDREPETAHANLGEVILVVEDEEAVRSMTARLLESEGYKVLTAADGVEALDCIQREIRRLDLVITDVAMPAMNGRELADQLKRIRPGLPVLFMSGYTDDEMVRRGLIEPAHPFLSKPFTPEILAGTVRLLIDQAASRR
jgi:two-component system, cell cycle sensor histidine kinase and response regulator CckA